MSNFRLKIFKNVQTQLKIRYSYKKVCTVMKMKMILVFWYLPWDDDDYANAHNDNYYYGPDNRELIIIMVLFPVKIPTRRQYPANYCLVTSEWVKSRPNVLQHYSELFGLIAGFMENSPWNILQMKSHKSKRKRRCSENKHCFSVLLIFLAKDCEILSFGLRGSLSTFSPRHHAPFVVSRPLRPSFVLFRHSDYQALLVPHFHHLRHFHVFGKDQTNK